MRVSEVSHILIAGGGLAGAMCAFALSRALPDRTELTWIDTQDGGRTDAAFGTATTPYAYECLLGLGLTEPDFLPFTRTTFSLGTHYMNWGLDGRAWMQGFHAPLPTPGGVDFQHYLTRLRKTVPDQAEIEPYVMSVQAAHRDGFAHPPEGPHVTALGSGLWLSHPATGMGGVFPQAFEILCGEHRRNGQSDHPT